MKHFQKLLMPLMVQDKFASSKSKMMNMIKSVKVFRIMFFIFLHLVLVQCILELGSKKSRIWQMNDGLVVVEVESVLYGETAEGFWELVTDSLEGYTGDGAFIWKGEGNMYKDPLVHDAPLTDGKNKLSYEIMIPEDGEYELKIRNYHQLADGDNDAWISINKQIYQKIWDHDTTTWTWSEAISNINTYQPFYLKKGINTVDIVGRSKGWVIDRFVIYKKGTSQEKWADIKMPESETLTQIKFDRKAPELPDNLIAESINMSTVALSWEPAKDDNFVYYYDIYMDDEYIGNSYTNNFVVTGLSPSTKYSFTVRAFDLNRKDSGNSEALNITTEGFKENEGLIINKVRIPPTIDGKIDGLWDELEYNAIENVIQGEPAMNDLNAKFKIAWDESYIYLLVKVNDDMPVVEKGKFDGIEVYLDMNNSKDLQYLYSDRIYRFALSIPRENGKFHNSVAKINRNDFVKGLMEERSVEEDGYLFEVAFPWLTLGIVPSEDDYIGFDIKVKDYDEKPEMKNVKAWFAEDENVGRSPYFLGTAKLVSQVNY